MTVDRNVTKVHLIDCHQCREGLVRVYLCITLSPPLLGVSFYRFVGFMVRTITITTGGSHMFEPRK